MSIDVKYQLGFKSCFLLHSIIMLPCGAAPSQSVETSADAQG